MVSIYFPTSKWGDTIVPHSQTKLQNQFFIIHSSLFIIHETKKALAQHRTKTNTSLYHPCIPTYAFPITVENRHGLTLSPCANASSMQLGSDLPCSSLHQALTLPGSLLEMYPNRYSFPHCFFLYDIIIPCRLRFVKVIFPEIFTKFSSVPPAFRKQPPMTPA